MSLIVPKNALATAALAGALAVCVASPASAFNLFGFNLDGPAHPSHRNYTPRTFDGGGNVFSYYGRAHASNRTEIAGVCASACTMKLGSRNACVARDATLLFHQASYDGSRSELGTRMMLYSYPARIRHWVLRSGALNSSSLTALSGSQAIAMGMRAC
jgi:hypothetical protein